jgi:hypothetical protein
VTEKEKIEKATAEAFVELYNNSSRTSFRIVEYADSPDVRCEDSFGNKLAFEITMTEDRVGDIQARLGRSNQRDPEALRKRLGSSLAGNVSAIAAQRIQAKLNKDYGSNVALVVRDTSGVPWDWDLAIDEIVSLLNLDHNPFDCGIWIVSSSKDQLFRII